jgi:hypothetical protein
MQAGRSDQPDEAQRVAYSCDDLSKLIEIVSIVFELAQLLDLVVDMLTPFVWVVPRIIILIRVFLKPFAVSAEDVLDILHEEELAEGRNLPE